MNSSVMMAGNQSMLVTLTVGELMSLVKDVVHDELKPIYKFMMNDSSNETDVRGRHNICDILKCDSHELTRLAKVESLGRVLYKDKSKGSNAVLRGIMPHLQNRYISYLSMPYDVREAFDALGVDTAEAEWKKRGL